VGLYGPMPIARTKEEIEDVDIGRILKVEADDPASEADIPRWAKRSGNVLTFWIRRKK
jgi:tRNA 2-thiouridine synthesizing protein A